MTTVRRGYLYLASFIGMFLTVAGIIVLIGQLIDQGANAFRSYNVSIGSVAIALMIVGAVGWRFYWRAVQRDASSTLEERSSGTRKVYLYGTMTISLWLALGLLQQRLGEFLVRMFDTQ